MLAESQTSLSKLRKGDCRAENTKKREEGYAREKTGKRRKASSFLMSVITVGMKKKMKGERGWLCERENGKKKKASSFLMSIPLDFCVVFWLAEVLGEMFFFFPALFYLEGLALWWVPQMQKMRTAENENFTSPLLRIRLCRHLLLSLD